MSNEIIKVNFSEFEEKKELIKGLYCKGLTEQETEHFFSICMKMQLNPMAKQIYVYKLGGKMTIIVSIDGLRLTADRTKQYAPGKETVFAYKKDGSILSATAYVKKLTPDGAWHEVSAVAFFDEYTTGQNLWKKMPHVMIAKCAEAQALRRAFPAELSGVYTQEEMDQAKEEEAEIIQDEEEIIEPSKDITLQEASSILSKLLEVKDDSTLSKFVGESQAATKLPFAVLTNSWIQKPDKVKDSFARWQLKKAAKQ
jgi:phage recombination protein Bet